MTNGNGRRVAIVDGCRTPFAKSATVFADMTALSKQGLPGLPDGMAIDAKGNLFATGPGGVHVFSAGGQRLGRIDTGKAIANATFGEDGHSLFLASDDILVRVRTKTKGLGY